jgi:hypothetical protein
MVQGIPVLDISYNYDDGAHKAMVIVQQKQKGQIFQNAGKCRYL